MLRELTAQDFRLMDGVLDSDKAYSPDRMIITNGSQQMLYMVTEAMCDEGDIVLVEDPTYFVYLGILQSHGLQGRGIRMTQDGIDLEHLDATLKRLKKTGELKRVKMLYLVSYYQNPTGVTTSFAKKAGGVEAAPAIREGGGASDLSAGRRGVSRIAVRGRGREIGAGGAGFCQPRDLRGHLQQAVCDGHARGFRDFAGAGLYGGDPHQGQPRFRHVEPAAAIARAGDHFRQV